jgi:hypothetical protein
MTDSSEDLAAVEQLLAESDALHDWLARLDQAPGAVPDSVRHRVRDDYQRRLDQVTAGLRAHAAVIATKLQDERSERAELQARAKAAREAMAEVELRHAVGEYSDQKFESERRRHASDLETFELSLGAGTERIARLEEAHAVVQGAPGQRAIDVAPTTTELVIADVPALIVDEVDLVAIADLAPDADDGLAIFDDPDPAADAEDSLAHPVAPIPDSGPLSFRPSGAGSDVARSAAAPPAHARPFDSAPPLGIPGADVPPRFVRPGGERVGAKPAPPAATPATAELTPASSGDPIVMPDAAPDGSAIPVGRTLRCGECGAMNRPLEWYCEKCGAELTAV